MARKKTHEEFIKDFSKKGNPNVIIVGEYINDKTKILVKCKIDGYEWYAYPSNLLKGRGCSVCAGRIVVPHVNSVAAVRPDLVQYFKSISDAFDITVKSNRLVDLVCPDCGSLKKMYMYDLSAKGFICSECSSNISYPNRLIRSFMKQFKHELEHLQYEWSDDWTNNQRYDVYFIKNGQEFVIEMQGGQHYNIAWNTDVSIEEVIKKDHQKAILAVEHGLTPIIIDARYSDFDFIFNNIQNSILSNIFDLSDFNAKQCRVDATKNVIKNLCERYNARKDVSTKELAELYGVHSATIVRYLKQGSNLGWCDYDPDKSKRQSRVRAGKGVKVYNASGELIHEFYAILQCSIELSKLYHMNFSRKSISNVCKGTQESYHGFVFEYA